MLKAIVPSKCYLLFMLLSISLLSSADHVSKDIKSPSQLIKALQTGGHIIYMRHGPTFHDQKDQAKNTFESCDNQRNISIQGREAVGKIAHALKKSNIPIGQVFSSPFCRCKDTAKIAFGHFKVLQALKFSMTKDAAESKKLGDTLHNLMTESEVTDKNQVYVGHTSNLRDGLGIWPKPEAVMVIFKKEKDTLIYKGMIKPNDWP